MADRDGCYIGLMSGTSLDGVDGVLVRFVAASGGQEGQGALRVQCLAHVHGPLAPELVASLRRLNQPGNDELHTAAVAANTLAQTYAEVVQTLCRDAGVAASAVRAIGAHGQTVRHHPNAGQARECYTIQLNNPALLVEQTGIAVVADFRRRDMAAGGQGAPLVPPFHRAVFGTAKQGMAVLNLGGIANLSLLFADGRTQGFDSGPANTLLDAWCQRHTGQAFDADGDWAAGGVVEPALLQAMLGDPYFAAAVPKSTGLDHFNLGWLEAHLARLPALDPRDVQASLAELTAVSCAQALRRHGSELATLGVCGGGAYNRHLMRRLQHHLGADVQVQSTADWGIAPDRVEAMAFAWLARQCLLGLAGNEPGATHARGARVLGAIYPV
ncbi:anhydro-N-acetylmuramic acid kinase [Corticibacter populi]|uniref:Anhydro-N-acetylmuramic acid kinase n=1 Tax=Corticibacter populi TaxID=1550736 RepID=A0A3M6R0S5_9BURK|nr:anhydro-N-acetylmuramic acid kinase [Corticibacter populi]RMX08811.1 anhydro-N-acetylmuramic acid kinase [Corticibacter populi]